VKSVTGSISGPVYPEEFGLLLLGIFGSEAVTGTGPYQHTFTLNSGNPPSITIQVDDPVQPRRYLGCQISSLGLTYNAAEGLVTYSADLVGKDMETATAGTFSEPGQPPWPGWKASLTLGGQAFAKVMTAELTFAREVQQVYALANTQLASFRDVGPMEVTGRLTAYFDSDADYNRFLNKTQDAFVLTIGSGNAILEVTCTRMDYGDSPAEIDRFGTNLALNFTLRALYNSTDGGPAKVVLTNSTATAY
jgi:hypothetical protein